MILSPLYECIRRLANAFYRSLLKLSINTHQLIAHWRSRISRSQRNTRASSNLSSKNLNVELKQQHSGTEPQQQQSQTTTTTTTTTTTSSSSLFYWSNESIETGQPSGLPSKTPNSRKSKIYLLFRRLSIRNFMDYCVIALNEASSSSSSNKFDLSSSEKSVWLLGKHYELPRDAEKLVDDVRSKLWITYRRNFPPIDENTRYTTDKGFGCMIRCGQMVLANALLYKNLGRDWNWSPNGIEHNPAVYFKILKLFQDKEECAYSIHNIVRNGQQEGKVIGEWFGPNTIAQTLKRMAISSCPKKNDEQEELLISIDAALDNVVVKDEIISRFRRQPQNPINISVDVQGDIKPSVVSSGTYEWTPGLLFIQLRLGLTKINPLYFAALKKTFQLKSSLGIIGGRPNHALYLIGYTEEDIIYLDPHSTQQYIDFDANDFVERLPDEMTAAPLDSSYHCSCPEKMPLDRLDPSLALCFYFHTEDEFNQWCDQSNELLVKSEQAPMFEIAESRPSDWNVSFNSTTAKSASESSCSSFASL